MKNRKQLCEFGYLSNIQININELLDYCRQQGLLNFDRYNDIKASANSSYKDFVVANEFCKDSFFKESEAPMMEGEKYKQLYLTELDPSKRTGNVKFKYTNIFERTKRLDPNDPRYVPEADERNYGVRNELVKGPIADLLDKFSSPLARVRLAYLAPHFSIKPHVDYDPSYVVRYHVPLITNEKCTLSVIRGEETKVAHFPADGRVYFLNAGLKHWASNDSDQGRLHLVIDVQQQDEVDFITPL